MHLIIQILATLGVAFNVVVLQVVDISVGGWTLEGVVYVVMLIAIWWR